MDEFDHLIINQHGKFIFTGGRYIGEEVRNVEDLDELKQVLDEHVYLSSPCREELSFRIANLRLKEAEREREETGD